MALPGAIEYKYSRVYRFIKPNSTDPGTWRLSVPETGTGSGGGGGGGGGGAAAHDIDGELPVEAVTVPGTPKVTTISLNFIKLGKR